MAVSQEQAALHIGIDLSRLKKLIERGEVRVHTDGTIPDHEVSHLNQRLRKEEQGADGTDEGNDGIFS